MERAYDEGPRQPQSLDTTWHRHPPLIKSRAAPHPAYGRAKAIFQATRSNVAYGYGCCEQADMTLHSPSTCVLGVGYLSSGSGSRNKHSPNRSQQGRHAKKQEGDGRPDPQQGPQRDTGRGAAVGATKNKADCATIPLSPKGRRQKKNKKITEI